MSSLPAVEPAVRTIIYLGMDVHKDSITIAVLPAAAKAPTRLDRLSNNLPTLKKWVDRVAREGDVRACYEASGAGYVLHRALRDWGYACEVIAPSLIPKRSGVPCASTPKVPQFVNRQIPAALFRRAMCEHARRRYAGRERRNPGIPDYRMSQLPTHPLLAALLLQRSSRRISAGSTVDAASGPRRPTPHCH